jgi:hypothetical protein
MVVGLIVPLLAVVSKALGGVDGLPKCCAIATRAMNRRGFMSRCQAQHRAKSAHSQ